MHDQKTVEFYCDEFGYEPFTDWLSSLKDTKTKARILQRLLRMENGNFGDHASVGMGVWELRLDFGPGYRVYYALESKRVVILLCAGNKKTQQKDIGNAHFYWAQYCGAVQ